MLRSLLRRRVVLFAVLALAIAGPAYALYVSGPGGFWPVVGPVPAGNYGQAVTISPALYADTIMGIETGRDDRSAFCAIVVNFNPPPVGTNPFLPIGNGMGGMIPGFPAVPPYTAPMPPGFTMRFVYRPVNEPSNPGWGPGAAAVNQLEEQMQTCVDVANQLQAFRVSAQTAAGVPIIPVFPLQAAELYLEFDPNPGPTHLEFYKFKIIRR